MTSAISFENCYQDIRRGFRPGLDPLNPLNLALVTQLPFPNGVLPELAFSSYFKAPADLRDDVANSCAFGPAIDSLIILLRLFLALGLDKHKSKEPKLFDLALHDFGKNMVDDYIVKGKLLEMLFPKETGRCERVDAILDDLIRHPLVRAALWSHPDLRFIKRESWTKKPGSRRFERSQHDEKIIFRDMPFQTLERPVHLGHYFSKVLGVKSLEGGGDITMAGTMPNLIPVIVKGGRNFKQMRSFVLNGPVDYRRNKKGNNITPVIRSFTYHLRAVANLADSDIRIYHQDTSPVVERLYLGDRPKDYYHAKLRRGEQAKDWTFEEGWSQWFLLIYAKYCPGPGGSPYQPPNNRFGEYIPVLTGRGEQRLSRNSYTKDPKQTGPATGTFF